MNTLVFLVVVGVAATTAQVTTGRCGDTVVSGRIIGGQNILRCTWPYTPLVSIKLYYSDNIPASNFGNLTISGGAVINNRYIVTSAVTAATMYGPDGAVIRDSARVLVGDFDKEQTDVGNDGVAEDIIRIADVKIHPGFSDFSTDNNIALLKLATPIRYNNCKRPACLLPQQRAATSRCDADEPEVDDTCIMASVGLTNVTATDTARIPQQARIKVFSRSVTEAILKASPGNIIPEGAVLGQTFSESTKTCLFDWGGIVVCFKSGRYWLRGLIGTNNCLVANNPAQRAPPILITEMSRFRDWIDTCVGSDFNVCPSLS